MGGAASVPIAGQTLPPQQYSPRKNLIPKLEESILVPEKTSTEVTMLSKASIFDAISNRDIPLVQAAVVVISLFVIIINLITDLVYAKLDPRIKL